MSRKSLLDKLPKHKMVLDPKSYRMAHPVYAMKDLDEIKVTHKPTGGIRDWTARTTVKFFRYSFDQILLRGFNPKTCDDERVWLDRVIFLESIAGIPGMVGAMQRHMRSLRTLERDHGWIHHLLQEAENERMHLFLFLTMRNPGIPYRIVLALAQVIVSNWYFLMYLISPKWCHRWVGYLEEEAVHTYTLFLEAIDEGRLPVWKDMKAPEDAISYYLLPPENQKIRDMISAIRADEACHRDLNHHFADIPAWRDVEAHEVTILEREDGTSTNTLKFEPMGLPGADSEQKNKHE